MRDIKFRALSIVNNKYNNVNVGDFVYGSFIQSNVDAPCIVFGDGEQVEIDPKTLGQFTGLQDKNGVDIYEGDVVACYPDEIELCYHRVVEWSDDGRCELGITNNGRSGLILCRGSIESIEVIGNIHKNPELLS